MYAHAIVLHTELCEVIDALSDETFNISQAATCVCYLVRKLRDSPWIEWDTTKEQSFSSFS